MAKTNLKNPFKSLHGSLTPGGVIHRKKTYRNSKGEIIAQGKQESYAVENPRDYKLKPATGAELANITAWREAANRTAQLLKMEKLQGDLPENVRKAYLVTNIPIYYTWQQASQILKDYHFNFDSQLEHPDLGAKRYIHFPSFIRAAIYRSLKA